jgi:acyl-CoA thioesterase-1
MILYGASRALASVTAAQYNGPMKNAAIIAGILTGLFFAGCDTGTGSGTEDGALGATLVCLGDSLTAGYGAVTPGVDGREQSYPAHLQNRVAIPVVNAGVTGDTTAQGLARVNAALLQNSRIVIVELGANDLFQGVPLTATRNNLQSIINAVRGGNRKIYLAKFYTGDVVRGMISAMLGITDHTAQNILMYPYDTMFAALAASNDVELIDDIWDGVWGIHMSDPIHPDAAGYKIMADNYIKALRPYLLANGLLR